MWMVDICLSQADIRNPSGSFFELVKKESFDPTLVCERYAQRVWIEAFFVLSCFPDVFLCSCGSLQMGLRVGGICGLRLFLMFYDKL